ncbi:MAG: aminopeptidase P family protein [Bryobacterales bacterium]|nr:aminopeptidase P family protein [Bryobacterales bacterium]
MSDPVRAGRRQSILRNLDAHRTDALLVTALPNIRYLSGFTGSNGVLLLTERQPVLFTDPRYEIQAAAECDCPVRIAGKGVAEEAARAATRRRVRRLGYERNRISLAAFETLRAKLGSGTELVPFDGLVETARMVKSAAEIAHIRASVKVNSQAYERTLRMIKPGRTTELDIAAELDYRMRRLGASGPAFDTIVAVAERSALPHAQPSTRVFATNILLLIDMGAFVDGYASDMTRVVALGKAPRSARRVYSAVLEAQLAAIDAIRPGVTAGQVDRAARRVLAAHGLAKAFVHSTGHGLGLEIHEPPRLGHGDGTVLAEGMAVTIEPGAYLDGQFGVRIEDTVVVTADGCDVLTPTPKELLEI